MIAERGARVEGRVVASDPGKTNGVAALMVELSWIDTSDGQSVPIRTGTFERRADPSSSDRSGRVVAGGAIVRDGAGGGVATGGVWVSRNHPAILSPDTRISFRLSNSVSLTERTR